MSLDKIKKLCLHSWTVAWAHLKLLSGLLILAAPEIGNALNDPQIASHLPSKWVGLGLMGVAIVTYAARILPHRHQATLN